MSGRLRVLPLGGLGEIGKNMMVIEYEGSIVVVDVGLRFPTPEMVGIDLVLPDFSYLRDRASDIEAIVLYNIPQRTGSDMPNDLLAELAQLDHVSAVKQANADNVAHVDGLQLYAGNDDLLATVLDMGEPGGILTGSHVFGKGDPARNVESLLRAAQDATLQRV